MFLVVSKRVVNAHLPAESYPVSTVILKTPAGFLWIQYPSLTNLLCTKILSLLMNHQLYLWTRERGEHEIFRHLKRPFLTTAAGGSEWKRGWFVTYSHFWKKKKNNNSKQTATKKKTKKIERKTWSYVTRSVAEARFELLPTMAVASVEAELSDDSSDLLSG